MKREKILRVVVIGGFGNFGARICRRLMQEPAIEVIAAGRRGGAPVDGLAVVTARLDLHAAEFPTALAALAPNVVIHCAGPFQGQDYRVAAAALACGAHYLDLADGREFVTQFAARNHAAAIAANRVAVTGASTLPALSSAVVDQLSERFARIDAIEIAIALGQNAPRGAATVAAGLGYAGQAFPWWIDGAWRTAYGWQELRRMRFLFGTRHAAACDVPDLVLFPARYAGVRSVTFRAALGEPLQHYALWGIAGLRRIGVPLPVQRWAHGFNRLGTWLNRFGGDYGGMLVHVTGVAPSDSPRQVTWNVVARGNHGPEIPCMAAALLTRKIAAAEAMTPGASACVGMLKLSEFESEFARWDISTSIEDSAA